MLSKLDWRFSMLIIITFLDNSFGMSHTRTNTGFSFSSEIRRNNGKEM